MSSPLFPDPMQFWRDALTKLEGEANTLVSGTLKNPEAARSAQKLASVALSLQQFSDKAMTDHLRRLNIPSRKDVSELSDALVRIEGKLDQLMGQLFPGEAGGPRPSRTRRPSAPPPSAPAVADEAQAAAPPAEAEAAPAQADPVPTRAREAAETARAKPRAAKTAPAERRRGTRASKG